MSGVEVFDQILQPKDLRALDDDVSVGGLGHTVLIRKQATPRTVTESIIMSILNSLDDKAPVVEYWWRDEWMSLELHRDVDEKLARRDGTLRTPLHAHVLYIEIGEDVRGPTIILHDSDIQELPNGQFDRITVVPAIAGRLLRFDGRRMHAVPRPAFAYLDPEEGGSNVEIWTRRRPVDSEDPEYTVNRRSVLLFNTWSEAPLDISTDPPAAVATRTTAVSDSELQCNAFSSWKSCVILADKCSGTGDDQRDIRLKIGLLGDAKRRERSARYLELLSPADIKEALSSGDATPVSFGVRENSP
jgi:hypothetical protein